MNPEQAIVDSSVYVSLLRQGRFQKELLELPLLVRYSAVVIAELLRGARSKRARSIIHDLYGDRPLLTPTQAHWSTSGEITAALGEAKRYDPSKLRELHFDVLIALSARSIGAHVITSNAEAFLAIRAIRGFKLVIWS